MSSQTTQQLVSDFALDVRDGLTRTGQRELPSKYLYDEVGSELFEAICLLQEYGLTRADTRLLQRYAGEIISQMPLPTHVAEFGIASGTCRVRKRARPIGLREPGRLRKALSGRPARGGGSA